MTSFKSFFNSSTCSLVVAPSYKSIYHDFCFTKLLNLILVSFFSGIFLCYHKVLMIKPHLGSVTYFLITWSLFKYIWYHSPIIILSDDIKTNSGPKHYFSSQNLKICHWDLNSLLSHMYKKVSLPSTFNSVDKLDIICLSKTYLNSGT